MSTNYNPDFLRPVEVIHKPDPRTLAFVRIDRDVERGLRNLEAHDYHNAVAAYSINSAAPTDVLVHFETAKNLYVYAWFVYRFFPVAEHQALASLELALRMRFADQLPENYVPKNRDPTLKQLLRYAIDTGHIKNEGFKKWHQAVAMRARNRYEEEKLEEMRTKGLDRIALNYDEIEIVDVDRKYDYVKHLLERLPKLRNHYAHGSSSLHNRVLGTIQSVSEIINQIYPQPSAS